MRETATLKITEMTCAMCSAAIEDGLEKMQGVFKASVSYAKGKAIVEYDAALLQLPDIKAAIHKLGYSVDEKSGHKR